jgi:hypothetical protein
MSEMVLLYDFKTKKVTPIPARELAPGMIKVQIKGLEGEYWVNSSELKQSAPLHPPFAPEYREVFAFLQATFHDVCPMSIDEWEDGFRRDATPEKEIQSWVSMAKAFTQFTDGLVLTAEERGDIFYVSLLASSNGPENVLITFNPTALSKVRGRQIVEQLAANWKQEQ